MRDDVAIAVIAQGLGDVVRTSIAGVRYGGVLEYALDLGKFPGARCTERVGNEGRGRDAGAIGGLSQSVFVHAVGMFAANKG